MAGSVANVRQPGHSIQLLLVEDNDISVQVVRECLAKAWPDAFVARAADLAEAIAEVQAHTWDVILLDLGLPGCGGLDALRRLREHDRTAAIVVLTAREDEKLAALALEAEAQDYLTKREISPSLLARAIRYAMGRQQTLVRMQGLIEEARAQERNLRELVERSADAVLVFDSHERVTFANDVFVSLFERSAESVLGHPLPVIDLGLARSEVELTTESGLKVLEVRVVPVEWQRSPCRMALVRDQTERRRSEQLQAQLERSERLAAIGKLVAGIAHEINNPLTYVVGSLDAIQVELDAAGQSNKHSERIRQLSDAALEGAERVVSIVRDLSVFSRKDSDDELRPTSVNDALVAALKMVQTQLSHRAAVVRELGEVGPVVGHLGRLTQVFVNLLVNAAHAIEEGHVEDNRITVRTWQEGDRVFASVRDTGCGMAAEVRERLFEPFFTTKLTGDGTGLGLYVCRSIVDSYRGDIRVESEPNQGTFVCVALRLWSGDTPERALSVQEAPSIHKRRARILVVDDEARIRTLLAAMLGAEHDVVTRGSGREAQALLAADSAFDVILCDVVMDDGSGVELEAWLRAHAPGLTARLLFMSGGGIGERSAKVSREWAERVLAKPFRRAEVMRRVRSLVEESESAYAEDPAADEPDGSTPI
jgi:signal transduction histidine kinase